MTAYYVRYACSLHDDPHIYVVDVPWAAVAAPPACEAVWEVIRNNKMLLEKLFGESFNNYEDMANRAEHYESLLDRTYQCANMKIDYYPEDAPVSPRHHPWIQKCHDLLKKGRPAV